MNLLVDAAARVKAVTKCTPEQFAMEFRNTAPVVLKGDASTWSSTRCWGQGISLLESVESIEIEILHSINGTTFFKHELCTASELNSHAALAMILTASSAERSYCRLGLEEHPKLLKGFDSFNLQEIASFGSGSKSSVFRNRNSGVWISSAGCVTPLHFDNCHGFLAQVVGRKRFILAHPSESGLMYRQDNILSKNQLSSKVDLDTWVVPQSAESKQFPNIADVEWLVADLEPGDVLYTPPGFWHHVTSIDISISVLLPFDPTPNDLLPNNVLY